MAQNPYASFNASADPYTSSSNNNTNPYANAPTTSYGNGTGTGYGGLGGTGTPAASSPVASRKPSTDDYDPYSQERYGTPPIVQSSSRQRPAEPRQQASTTSQRPGGYGGFYKQENGSGHIGSGTSVGNGAREQQYAASRSREDLSLRQRRPSEESKRIRREDTEPLPQPQMPATRDFRRPSNPNNYPNNTAAAGSAPSAQMSSPQAVGEGTRQIEEVLQHIEEEWSFMSQEKCVPVQVALQLMDSSSLGRANQYDQFQQTHKQLQRALKAIVNEHHQGFNSSIGTFHKIQASIQASQSRLQQLKANLGQAKVGLSSTRPELKGLAASSHSYDEMLQALGQIEHLRLVTDKLEARISEKRFLTAVDVLQDALRLIRKPEMDNIGALSELRLYLANQETSLADILVEELHNHLYLKSPYCQDRWKAHVKEISGGSSKETTDFTTPAIQPMCRFLDDLDIRQPMTEDAGRNPEADSFYYIQLLVESLNKMGKLRDAVEAIEQRLPVELFRVVDKSNNEVDQRHPTSMRAPSRAPKGRVDLGIDADDKRAVVVSDLLWTLYAKFEAIAEGHRVFHEVVVGITEREQIEDAHKLTGSFKELWMLYQNEIRSLLHDYLATESNTYRMSQTVVTNHDVFRRGQRNPNKKVFSLNDADPKSEHMTAEFDDLEAILKASVPGLVSDSRRQIGKATDDSQKHTDGAATGHKLLIEPSVFNMGSLLPPSLSFLQRLKDIVPPGRDIKVTSLTSFLDDFLINVFLPQLDETLVKYSSQIFDELDAFQEDPRWSDIAQRPIFKGASAFLNLLVAFCKMLDTIPHDQAFTQLIINQLVSYYDRCCDWYQALVSRSQSASSSGPSIKTAAAIATGPGDIHEVVKKLWAEPENQGLMNEEIKLFVDHVNKNPITVSDIISDRKTIASLCLLYTSMRWLAGKVNQLRMITTEDADSSRRRAMRSGASRRWTLLNTPNKPTGAKNQVYLPMTTETVVAFDSIVSSCRELAGTVLLTLHMEPRSQIALALAKTLSSDAAPYLLQQQVHDADASILSLNSDLVAYDEAISTYLRDNELSFIRTGLAGFIDSFLVTNAGHVGSMNKNGCDRMMLNILVLQQNLKNIEPEANLSRAEDYFDLFLQGREKVLEKAKEMREVEKRNEAADSAEKEEAFTYDELKTLIELCWSAECNDPERGVSTVAKRKMGEQMLQLSEIMWQS